MGGVQIEAELMSTCQIKKVGHYKGLCFCISSCAQKKGVLCSKCDDQSFLKFAQHLPSVPGNVCSTFKYELWSSSDENSINEYTSNKKGRTYEGLLFGISSCAQKKRLACSKCDDQIFVKLAHHLPLGPVNVW